MLKKNFMLLYSCYIMEGKLCLIFKNFFFMTDSLNKSHIKTFVRLKNAKNLMK